MGPIEGIVQKGSIPTWMEVVFAITFFFVKIFKKKNFEKDLKKPKKN